MGGALWVVVASETSEAESSVLPRGDEHSCHVALPALCV